MVFCFIVLEFHYLDHSLVAVTCNSRRRLQHLSSNCVILLLQKVVISKTLFYSFVNQKRHLLTNFLIYLNKINKRILQTGGYWGNASIKNLTVCFILHRHLKWYIYYCIKMFVHYSLSYCEFFFLKKYNFNVWDFDYHWKLSFVSLKLMMIKWKICKLI